jgi:hypothetical protein
MSNVSGSTGACKPDFAACLVVFARHGSGTAWDCWMRAVCDCGRDFRCLKTGLLAVADGSSTPAQETAQDMGLDQILEAGEAAGGHHSAAGGLTADHAIMLMLMSISSTARKVQRPLWGRCRWISRSSRRAAIFSRFAISLAARQVTCYMLRPDPDSVTASPVGALPVDKSEFAPSSHFLTICHLLGRAASHLLHVKTRPRFGYDPDSVIPVTC